KKPMQMMGANHYIKFFHFVTTSAAPIFDPDGQMMGCISVSNFYLDTHPHTLFMAVAAAQAIENEWRVQKALVQYKTAFAQTDIAASLQKVILSSIPEALIVVNHEGDIMTINEKASRMFALDNVSVPGMALRKIFKGEENASFLAAAEQKDSVSDKEVRIRTAQGAGDYSLTCNCITLSGGAVIGKLLIFSEIQRIKSLVARTIGAKANFTFNDVRCRDKDFKKILDQARGVSPSTSNVLLLGESGTGKDILAQAIHNASPRKDGPYVAINCAAIPRDLIASELFGHAEGAYTGSRRGGSQGKFELADGGTIFLDEIAEMSLDIQAVLLRVIEDKCVVRIGSSRIRSIDVRIISATNRDLLDDVKRSHFRKDLYYRLNVFNIHLPPLRERQDDIPLLTEYFIQKYAKAQGKIIHGADDRVIDVFMNYRWPGNVRELQNVVERMVNYAASGQLSVNLIPPEIVDTRPVRKQSLDFELPSEKEKRLLRHMLSLKLSKDNVARQLNMSRTTLYRKLKRYGLLRLNEN
ncbi:MAG TPA: sigma 54-interacting transcriptional regulator, partial [Smithellaceae bacterium]|nr:sigma 54-interacting transcriptional regulator [Smithellaceae bacterium]